jgi:opacity protein-like surface antigen
MKVHVMALVAFLAFAMMATASDVPRFETYFGWDWIQFNPDRAPVSSFTANGGSAQFVYNFAKGFGVTFDAGAVSRDTLSGILSNRQTHFLVGPRYGFYNHSRFTPFGQILFGGSNGSVSLDVTDINQVPTVLPTANPIILPDNVSVRLQASRTAFAMMVGGGLDIRLTKHVTYRLFDTDYYLTRPASLITGQDVNKNNFRVTTGVNFTWGGAH